MILMDCKSPQICLVVFFLHEAFSSPLSNIRQIIAEIFPGSYSTVVTGPQLLSRLKPADEKNRIIIHSPSANPLIRIINYFILNLKISWNILKRSQDTDIFLFFMETGLPIPMLIAKLRKKKIIWLFPSSLEKRIEHHHDFINLLLFPFQSLSYIFTDKIVLYSPNLIKEWKLDKYSDKILFAHEHFIDTKNLTTTIPFYSRIPIIAYIGRLSEEKGVRNFVQSIPAVLENNKELTVIIGGDGPLKEEIDVFLVKNGLDSRVELIGWISAECLPQYLNKLQLLVLPSYTEGLPNIMLEAMACGTPVLATPVGAIPDFIRDGETGFIMENNSSACISENIIRAQENPDLEKITITARKMVEKEFSFEGTVSHWKKIFEKQIS
jgi:glycosyltransferase involved in cell wall biosynthesis